MGAQLIQTRAGPRWRYKRQARGVRLQSRAIYLTRQKALEAEADAISHFTRTGEIIEIPPTGEGSTMEAPCETVAQLLFRWVRWLENHRTDRHAYDMQGLFARALAQAPEYAPIPADQLTSQDIEAWAETWAADLVDRGKGRGEVNKFLRHGQTAFNAPWGRRRARPEYSDNPFKWVDRFSVEKRAKYVPTGAEVASLLLVAGGEFRLYLEILEATAARVSEAREMAWEQVLPGHVILYTIKTATGDRRPRRVEIDRKLAARFRAWRREQGPGKLYVFQQEDQEAPRVPTWELKQMRRLCELADVKYFPPGCFRHYRASKWAADGQPLTWIQARLGHTQATTTNNYLHEIGAQ